jgi:hypothetical protein
MRLANYTKMLRAAGFGNYEQRPAGTTTEVRVYVGFGLSFSHYFDAAGKLVNVSASSECEGKKRKAR